MRSIPVVLLVAVVFAPTVVARAEDRPFKVVVDPGHGGESMGALGAYGIYEKYVTLSIALRLGRLLESEQPRVATFFTRRDDVFVDLPSRPALANAVGADAFVSIHCNASPSPEPFGVETFYLGAGGTDADADQVADRENAAGAAPGEAVPETADDAAVAAILGDLRRTGNLVESAALAETVQRRLAKGFPETQSRDVRQARFAVLKRATMPAIVVEVGFLTHAEEGMNLLLATYQERIAAALRDAILEYARGRRW
ncbi:MAG: N-acetylmuramoyl-L-alanine amidase [Deltaproteobacteria bacterium]|nr:N-acetylmuramoyl-L-alanine amidase [Deltaproteobacteria bacterium]